jgi:hypothetical protein
MGNLMREVLEGTRERGIFGEDFRESKAHES